MKKLFVCLIALFSLITVASCNYKMLDFKWEFNYAYITVGDEVIEVEVKNWREDETTFTIVDTNDQVYMTDQKNVVMTKTRLKK